jgi:glycosyltransferase involved in cell wall biosynthesis
LEKLEVDQGPVLASVVIAAHNESAVIGNSLDTLLAGDGSEQLDITVVANGCTDGTAEVARRRHGVRVVETSQAGKAAALNLGDGVARGFPRIYVDADIPVTVETVRALATALQQEGVLAVVPVRRLDTSGRPAVVRGYFAINSRLPAFTSGVFGRGVIALSAQARARFDEFPLMVADDLFLDSLFTTEEKRTVTSTSVLVAAPWTSRDLLRRLIRVRRGNAAMRAAGRSGAVQARVRPPDRLSWLRDVVLPAPRLLPAAFVYVLVTAVAAVLARASQQSTTWGRDDSTRHPQQHR